MIIALDIEAARTDRLQAGPERVTVTIHGHVGGMNDLREPDECGVCT